jgi:geranylgeranylglycerol-phosphate geranylgeranyltransferase
MLALSALIVTLPLGTFPTLVATGVMLLLTLYNLRLKSTAGGGNLLVAGLAGSTLFVGSVAVLGLTAEALGPLVLPAAVIGAFVATREVLKTMEDVDGDRAVGKYTVATRWGLPVAAHVVSLLALSTVILTPLPHWLLGYSPAYLGVVAPTVSLPLLYSAHRLQREPSPACATRCLALLKASYFGGLLALLLA